MVRGLTPKDYDIATDARPETVQALFPRTYAVGAHFGVIIVLEDGFQFEVGEPPGEDLGLPPASAGSTWPRSRSHSMEA